MATPAGQALLVSLVARRSVQRAGARHWRRGADRSGAAANFVETEQVVATPDDAVLASFVQVTCGWAPGLRQGCCASWLVAVSHDSSYLC